ncbi:MAG TPA: type III-A CRISPR-associated RAMP protein Csm5 [bacterium]|nr:type III-A CRISPR-associated RAMP protein Csm5 [bacterium]HQI47891.1 type III-A CRISPR-associated RAMP protein Csm5 [bacterium]HQJ66209.1 type III-A CRISPR-associated RAMP protein Csm5 [bacterium]
MKLRLKLLTPLHIGGPGVLFPMEYISFKNRLYVISEPILARLLAEEGHLDGFTRTLGAEGKGFSLKKYLSSRDLLYEKILEQIAHYICNSRFEEIKELRPFSRDAFSRPYVPGTSIKGALRTAVLYCILKRMDTPTRVKMLDDRVQNKLFEFKSRNAGINRGSAEKFKQSFMRDLDAAVFRRFTLKQGQGRDDEKTDILRALKVSDALPWGAHTLEVKEVKVFSAFSNDSPKKWSIYAECALPGMDVVFDLSVSEEILADFAALNSRTSWGMAINDMADLIRYPISCIKEMTQDILTHESRFYKNSFHMEMPIPSNADFHLGWGGSLLATSVYLLLPEPLRQQVRNDLFTPRGSMPAPKSRKLTMEQAEPGDALGWVQIVGE